MTDAFTQWQADFRPLFDTKARQALDPLLAEAPARLAEAIHYGVGNGGKRLRPMLVALSYALSQDQPLPAPDSAFFAPIWPAAIALELIHSYSLIHDDLPSMDNDDLRRGKPTLHRAFDEATAILTGDALQTLSIELLARCDAHEPVRLDWIRDLAQGANRMVFGQHIDLNANRFDSLEHLRALHRLKTGALLETAVRLGARAAGNARLDELLAFIAPLGLAFQIQDDILDATGTADRLGKTPGKDAAADKCSYVTLLGLTRAEAERDDCLTAATAALDALGAAADPLRALAAFVAHRTH
ncbi:polyprenyl synthetase family protein [Halothiobacillus sp. DCM-1]|uniref:polyprenyl synthetase family protein n=1 Tax=Halothiobacillus sp. DCM-1 TaxID=3112558 RepID=UPI00324F3413